MNDASPRKDASNASQARGPVRETRAGGPDPKAQAEAQPEGPMPAAAAHAAAPEPPTGGPTAGAPGPCPAREPSTGRPAPEVFAGVDIGGTTTQVVLCTTDLTVIRGTEVSTPAAEGGTAMVGAALDALHGLLETSGFRLAGVGVGAAGLVDVRAGRVLVASDSFHEWAGFPVTETVETALGVPAFLDNDVNAFLRGEATSGAVAGESHVLGMTLGTGVGGALWVDGALFDGPHGAAGEIGHIPGFGDLPCTCGGRGHLETLASGRSISLRYAERTGRHRTAREIAEAAVRDDAEAVAVFRAAGAAIARALLITAGLVDITTAVVGGGVSRAWPLLAPLIDAALAAEPPVSGHPIRTVRARLGSRAVAVGAASRVRTELGSGAVRGA